MRSFHHNPVINVLAYTYAITMCSLVAVGITCIVSQLIIGNIPQSFGIYG